MLTSDEGLPAICATCARLMPLTSFTRLYKLVFWYDHKPYNPPAWLIPPLHSEFLPYSCSYSVLLFISVLDKPGIHWALFQARERNGSAFRGFLYDVLTTIQPAVACRFSSNGLALRKFCLFCLEGFNDIATTNNKGAGRKTAD